MVLLLLLVPLVLTAIGCEMHERRVEREHLADDARRVAAGEPCCPFAHSRH
jgi:hypothetical protein